MPQLYSNAVITDAGLALLDRVQAGTASIQFTRMVTGDGTYTTDEKTPSTLKRCTGLKAQRNSYPLSSVSIAPNGGVKLTALITNQDPASGTTLVSEGYYINEIGLFAKEKDGADSTEVLYSITVARGDNGDYMPPYGGDAPVQIVQEYHAKVGNATSVTINSAGAVMLAEDAQREFEDLKRMIGEGGAIEDKTLTFEEAETRENIASGDRMDTILGKIRKFFVDLKRIAFTASYNDLVDTPDIPTVPDSLPASNVTSTYSSTGTEPVNGKAVGEALKSLDVAAKGGAGKYIQSISETGGKISAVEAAMPATLPAAGGDADTVGGKTAAELLDYNNLTNRPDVIGIASAIAGNLLPGFMLSKPDFYEKSYWYHGGSLGFGNADPFGGSGALGIGLTTDNNYLYSSDTNRVAVLPNKKFKLTVWMRATKKISGVKVTIQDDFGSNALCDITTEWRRFEFEGYEKTSLVYSPKIYIGSFATIPKSVGDSLYIYCPKLEYA